MCHANLYQKRYHVRTEDLRNLLSTIQNWFVTNKDAYHVGGRAAERASESIWHWKVCTLAFLNSNHCSRIWKNTHEHLILSIYGNKFEFSESCYLMFSREENDTFCVPLRYLIVLFLLKYFGLSKLCPDVISLLMNPLGGRESRKVYLAKQADNAGAGEYKFLFDICYIQLQ